MSRNPARVAVGVVLSLGIAVSALFFIVIMLNSARHQEQPMYDIAAALACAAFYIVLMRGPLGKAIHGMLDSSDDDALLEQGNLIDELMERAAQDRQHLQELEERVEFAERLLAHQPEVQLPAQRTPV